MNYCEELLSKAISEKEKREKTKFVYDFLLKNVFKKTKFELTNKHVKDTFIILDKVYFNYNISKFIKKTNSRISWKATSKLTKTAGFCKYKYFSDNYGNFDYGIYEINISKKIIDNIFDNKKIKSLKINGLHCKDRLECLINLYQHEITHLLIAIFCTKDGIGMGGHTRMFKNLAYNLFGHTEYKHFLLDGDSLKTEEEIKTNKTNLEIGDKIKTKEIKNTYFKGEVISLSKDRVKIVITEGKHKDKYLSLCYSYVDKIEKKSKQKLIKSNKLSPEEIKKKLKINDIVKVNIRGKISKGTIVNIGSTRASIIFQDGKKWYVPYNMIILK
jgi:hypothetical protein|tara:strand:- start:3239 stop:4225 length:987 start_codon:yes stop_codon:yes gene_type:complete